jgi:hypothetical protein
MISFENSVIFVFASDRLIVAFIHNILEVPIGSVLNMDIGMPPTAYVAIVEISMIAAKRNRLACISIPEIKILFIIHKGESLSLSFHIHFRLKRLFRI